MKITLLIIIGFSFFLEANNIVTDSQTNLEWQDNSESNSTYSSWTEAITYCENLYLDGKNDWRLPNKNELLSTVDYNRDNPAIKDTFTYTVNGSYWSSTAASGFYHNFVRVVSFREGGSGLYGQFNDFYVRCVRGG